MTRFRLHHWIASMISGITLVVVTLACSLPFQPNVTLPVEATSITTDGEMIEIPSKILTEVAATLLAPHQPTFTADAVEPQVSIASAQAVAPTNIPEVEPTQPQPPLLATASTTQQAHAQSTVPTVLPIPEEALATSTIPEPTAYQAAVPPASFTAQTGKAFKITGLNLHNCGKFYTANFLVENIGSQVLESLSLQLIDLNTDQDFFDPAISNAPFTSSDRTCIPGGISRLEPGGWLFVGGPMGTGQLTEHTILANFLFCTGEDLSGKCYPRSVEFIVP
jgi:hypothetical protein